MAFTQIHKDYVYNIVGCRRPSIPHKLLELAKVSEREYVVPDEVTISDITKDYVMTTEGFKFDIIDFMETSVLLRQSIMGGADLGQYNQFVVEDTPPPQPVQQPVLTPTPQPVPVSTETPKVKVMESTSELSEVQQDLIHITRRGVKAALDMELKDYDEVDQFNGVLLKIINSCKNLFHEEADIIECLQRNDELVSRIFRIYLEELIDGESTRTEGE